MSSELAAATLWHDREEALILLAKRAGNKRGHGWYEGYCGSYSFARCLICGDTIYEYSYGVPTSNPVAVHEHGMQHLKDSNLLPFM
jgi:hypothetical protein